MNHQPVKLPWYKRLYRRSNVYFWLCLAIVAAYTALLIVSHGESASGMRGLLDVFAISVSKKLMLLTQAIFMVIIWCYLGARIRLLDKRYVATHGVSAPPAMLKRAKRLRLGLMLALLAFGLWLLVMRG